LFSTSHTRYDGGTAQSNASATGITLTEPNLNTGVLAMQEVLDDKGQGIVVAESSVTLMVPPALRKTAVEITDSERKADTADNNMNYYAGWVNVLVNPWISARFGGSDTAWFLLAPKGETYLKYFWRRQPEFKQEDVFDTEVAKYRASARWSYGWSHWLGAWGSKGDGAAYSS
jgi:phage major head subunit gpT-like protein